MKKVVFFDKGDLLTDNKKKWTRFFEAVKAFHPAGFDRVDAKKVRRDVLEISHGGKMTSQEEMLEFLKRMGMEAGVIPEFMGHVEKNDLMNNQVFPGVRGTLVTLKERGYRLCIVSDTAKTAEGIVADIQGIDDLIECSYTSADFGKQKGEGLLPEVLAIEKPDQAWFVCHDDDELEAGLAAGINTIQIKDGSEIENILELIP
jgi:FMN phosphatase YigB (HAD superfamily)